MNLRPNRNFTKAIINNKLEIVRLLVENGADVNMVDGKQRIPLVEALDKGKIDILQILLQRGFILFYLRSMNKVLCYGMKFGVARKIYYK